MLNNKKNNLVNIKLHGILGELSGIKSFKYHAKTVGECLNAAEYFSKKKLYKILLENDKKGFKYRVLINGKDFLCQGTPSIENPETIKNSELCAKIDNLETIDIIPVLEGSGSGNSGGILSIVIGAILIVVGILVAVYTGNIGLGAAIIIAGIGLIAAGVINLLSVGPDLQPFKEKQKSSFLFSGPVNTVNEGGPVPVGYGRLIIGSSVISASYDIEEFNTGSKVGQNVNK